MCTVYIYEYIYKYTHMLYIKKSLYIKYLHTHTQTHFIQYIYACLYTQKYTQCTNIFYKYDLFSFLLFVINCLSALKILHLLFKCILCMIRLLEKKI